MNEPKGASYDPLTGEDVSPLHRGTWSGQFRSLDGVYAADFGIEDVLEVIHARTTGDQWEGTVAGVLRLTDGRYVSWETFYGPTGHGFSEDAYGGEADVFFAGSLETILQFGLTDTGRDLLGVTL